MDSGFMIGQASSGGYIVTLPTGSEQMNRSVCCVGIPGSGKSTFLHYMSTRIVAKGGTVYTFDCGDALNPEQIYQPIRDGFVEHTNDIRLNTKGEGFAANMLKPLKQRNGDEESLDCVVNEFADCIGVPFKAGAIQMSFLRKAISKAASSGRIEEEGFRAVVNCLNSFDKKEAKNLAAKVEVLCMARLFDKGGKDLLDGKINVFRLSDFAPSIQSQLTEPLLNYLFRLARAGQFIGKDVYIVLDEIQNLPSGQNSALSRLLSEGRKYGANLIFATQQLGRTGKSVVQERLTYAQVQIFFRPAPQDISQVAGILRNNCRGEWEHELASLKKGEFIACGGVEVNGKPYFKPLKVYNKVD